MDWVGGPITKEEFAQATPVSVGDPLLLSTTCFILVEIVRGSTIWCRSEAGILDWISRSDALAGKVFLARRAGA